MVEKLTLEEFEQRLDDGFQMYYTYVRNRYLLFKTSDNCFTQKLISIHEKNPHPVMEMLTRKRVHEMFPFMEEIEYKQNWYYYKKSIY